MLFHHDGYDYVSDFYDRFIHFATDCPWVHVIIGYFHKPLFEAQFCDKISSELEQSADTQWYFIFISN